VTRCDLPIMPSMTQNQTGASRMNDADTTLGDLRDMVREFRDRREWAGFHTPKNLSMAIAIEAAELMEEFLWLSADEAWGLKDNEDRLAAIGEELADVVIYALSFANSLELDVTMAVVDKLAKNAERYPEGDYRGKSSWLDGDSGGKA
jgi:dCTP diphosphatase